MSNRTRLEFNHDYAPSDEELLAWAKRIQNHLRCGDPKALPLGVTWFGRRHHSEACPMGEPPRGWRNNQPPQPEWPAGECSECPKYFGRCPYCRRPRPRPQDVIAAKSERRDE